MRVWISEVDIDNDNPAVVDVLKMCSWVLNCQQKTKEEADVAEAVSNPCY